MELFRPALVREERTKPQETTAFPNTTTYRYFDDVTEEGGLGDPTNADAAVMAEIVAETNDAILEQFHADIDNGW